VLGIDKPLRLMDVDLVLKVCLKEGGVDVHLVDLQIHLDSKGKKEAKTLVS
jgi:hypothetical protein